MRMYKVSLAGLGLLAAAVCVWSIVGDNPPAMAQSGTRGIPRGSGVRGGTAGPYYGAPTRRAPQTFEEKFWSYLQRNGYVNWAPWPGQSDDFYPGQSPHGAFLKMYLNRKAAGNPTNPPPGSIIIKENYSPDHKLMAVTVMYRVAGYDPEHKDWYWVKYLPDGTVARTPPDKGSMPIAGRFPSCIECHASAEGGDYLFANDAK